MALATKVVAQCPYRVSREVAPVKSIIVEERFDFQIEESGKIGRVSLGEFDLLKEVDSHKDEVGLINCLKMAVAKGLDPSTAYAKTEPGLMADPGDIDTMDDLIQAKAAADAKLAKIAEGYGLTVDQLVAMLKNGEVPKAKETEPLATAILRQLIRPTSSL